MHSDNVYCLWIADMQAGFISLHRSVYSDLWAAAFGCGTAAHRLVIMIFCATSACVVTPCVALRAALKNNTQSHIKASKEKHRTH